MQLNQTIDGLVIPKFGIGRGMAGKTLKFSLSRGGRPHLEKTIRLVQEQNLHPGMFVTEHLHGLDQIEQSVYDMKNRKAIKISVDLR
jgi:threonine dehydrogenase-like Zn-dependent dehydrogenase